jgi:hypothetical protein
VVLGGNLDHLVAGQQAGFGTVAQVTMKTGPKSNYLRKYAIMNTILLNFKFFQNMKLAFLRDK